VNLETIHSHDVIAERYGTAGELRAELDGGGPAERHTELREWLSSRLKRPADAQTESLSS
jgi:GTP cyclohydrolase IV